MLERKFIRNQIQQDNFKFQIISKKIMIPIIDRDRVRGSGRRLVVEGFGIDVHWINNHWIFIGEHIL